MRRIHLDGTQPAYGEHVEFGSDLAGRPGAGATKQALKYGAEYGLGVGLCGITFAIPTNNSSIRTLPLDTIRRHVDVFIEFARQNADLTFVVNRLGCDNAGYGAAGIAPMFVNSPPNCQLRRRVARIP